MISDAQSKIGYKSLTKSSGFLILEDEEWDYRIKLFERDFKHYTNYKRFRELMYSEFDNDLSMMRTQKDLIIKRVGSKLSENKRLREIIDSEIQVPDFIKPVYGKVMMYTPGHRYLSMDIKHCSSAVFDYYDLFNGQRWDDIMYHEMIFDLFRESKLMRIEICSEPRRFFNIKYHSVYLFDKIMSSTDPIVLFLKENKVKLEGFLGDELIWDITGMEDEARKLTEKREICGIPIRFSIIEFNFNTFKYDGKNRFSTIRTNIDTGARKYFGVSDKFWPQLIKLNDRKPVEERDLYIPKWSGYEKFDGPITDFKINDADSLDGYDIWKNHFKNTMK